MLLKKALKDRLDLEWNINKHGKYYYLRLRCKDISKFMDAVRPHILPSFEYKLIRTIDSSKEDGDIVCSAEESAEAHRNAEPVFLKT